MPSGRPETSKRPGFMPSGSPETSKRPGFMPSGGPGTSKRLGFMPSGAPGAALISSYFNVLHNGERPFSFSASIVK